MSEYALENKKVGSFMAIDTKKLLALTESSQVEMQQLLKALNIDSLMKLSEELKKIKGQEDELANCSPMLPSYIADLSKKVTFMIGTVNSAKTHASNRSKELEGLMSVLK